MIQLPTTIPTAMKIMQTCAVFLKPVRVTSSSSFSFIPAQTATMFTAMKVRMKVTMVLRFRIARPRDMMPATITSVRIATGKLTIFLFCSYIFPPLADCDRLSRGFLSGFFLFSLLLTEYSGKLH